MEQASGQVGRGEHCAHGTGRGQAMHLRGYHGPRVRGGLEPHQRAGRRPGFRGMGVHGQGNRPRQRQQQRRVSNEMVIH